MCAQPAALWSNSTSVLQNYRQRPIAVKQAACASDGAPSHGGKIDMAKSLEAHSFMHQLFGWVFRRLLLIDVLIGLPYMPQLARCRAR